MPLHVRVRCRKCGAEFDAELFVATDVRQVRHGGRCGGRLAQVPHGGRPPPARAARGYPSRAVNESGQAQLFESSARVAAGKGTGT